VEIIAAYVFRGEPPPHPKKKNTHKNQLR